MAKLLVVNPKGEDFSYAFRFDFPTTCNEVEYEALITGLRLTSRLGVKRLLVFNDSQLVVSQVDGTYETRGEVLVKYLACAKKWIPRFDEVRFQEIPWAWNKSRRLIQTGLFLDSFGKSTSYC